MIDSARMMSLFGIQTQIVSRAALAIAVVLIPNMNTLEFSFASTFQDPSPPVTILHEILVLIGVEPQKLDLIVWNASRAYVQSLTLHESQVRLDLISSHENVPDWSEIFSRKRADELPLVNIFLPANFSEMLDLLSQV